MAYNALSVPDGPNGQSPKALMPRSEVKHRKQVQQIVLTPGNSGASVTPKKNLTANKLDAFVVNAVAIDTPDQTKVVQGK